MRKRGDCSNRDATTISAGPLSCLVRDVGGGEYHTGPLDFEVGNFKALRSGRLEDRRTTLLAGANSSGKTSFIQAILLCVQSLGAGSLVLNGPLVTLGTPTDVLRSDAAEMSFSFSWSERGVSEPSTLRYVFVPSERELSLIEVALFRGDDLQARMTRWRPPPTLTERKGQWLADALAMRDTGSGQLSVALNFMALRPARLATQTETSEWSSHPMRALIEDRTDEQFAGAAAVEGAYRRVEAFLRSFVYLGPLRESPRVAYSLGYAVDSAPTGLRGELAAGLYERERNTLVPFRDESRRLRRQSVGEAVDRWCRYLEIGEGVHVSGEAKLGHRVALITDGVPRDLTSVGVGASQLLPVLILLFAAPGGSRILLEQPELHLHPGVQSRLADLFLDGRADTRLIVETHSEYLVTRLRRRVAEGLAKPGEIGLLFAERRTGVTTLRKLDMNEVGDFSVWPAGFFDELDEDGARLANAVRDRMRAMRRNQ